MMNCLYVDTSLEIGIGIWNQFISGLNHKVPVPKGLLVSGSSEISFARFWSVIVHAIMEANKVPVPEGSVMAKLPELHLNKIKLFKSIDYPLVPPMNAYLESFLPQKHVVVVKYK